MVPMVEASVITEATTVVQFDGPYSVIPETHPAFSAKLTHNGTNGRTYGGDPNLIHIPDTHRKEVGEVVADTVEETMRLLGTLGVGHPAEPLNSGKPLCPGCYMIALFDAAIILAERTGQDVREIGHTLGHAFADLAAKGKYELTEEMLVLP